MRNLPATAGSDLDRERNHATDLITGWLDDSIQTDRASVIPAATTMAFGL